MRGSRDLLLEFWDPSISRERFELETSNFACRLTTGGNNDKNEKLGQRGSGRNHVTYFWNLGTPFISRERLELETSNLACRLTTGCTNDKNEKLGQRGSGRGHVTYFWNLGTPSISRERFDLETFKFCMLIDHRGQFRVKKALTCLLYTSPSPRD